MRNLKRALSLLLAAAMLIGMMVVGASAAGSLDDFSDKDEIVNQDAVSLLTILGVIEGKEDGSYFDPTGNVTRAEMAKMIATILNQGADVDGLYTGMNTGLTDVAGHWAESYINYCYSLGIIAGRGDGTFDPGANVTGTEAAKMLLVAAGYDASIEGLTGADWAIRTAALASTLGIFDNLTAPTGDPLNRDNAALLVYNALDIEMIQSYRDGYAIAYSDGRTILSTKYGVYRIEGTVVGNEWAYLENTDSDYAMASGKTRLTNIRLVDSDTVNTIGNTDDGEDRPDTTFNVTTPVEYLGQTVTLYVRNTTVLANSEVLGVYLKDGANTVLTTAESQDTMKDYLKGTGLSTDSNTAYYVNYGVVASEAEAVDVMGFNDGGRYDSVKGDTNAYGIEMTVIDNNDDGIVDYVLYLQETLSQVTVKNDAKENTVLNGFNNNGTIDDEDIVTDMSLAEDDLVLVVSYGGRYYVSEPQVVTGEMESYQASKAKEQLITVGGTEYHASYIGYRAEIADNTYEFDITECDDELDGVQFDTTYDFILDSNGNVIAYRPSEQGLYDYALILDSGYEPGAFASDASGKVKVLLPDGTEGTYTLNFSASAKNVGEQIADLYPNDGVTYSTNMGIMQLKGFLGTADSDNSATAPWNGSYAFADRGAPANYLDGLAKGYVIGYSLNDDNVMTITSIVGSNLNDARVPVNEYSDATNSTLSADYNTGAARIRYNSTQMTVDKNTVAFYYTIVDGETKYGVAVGYNNMSDVKTGVDFVADPVRDTNLAAVVLFDAEGVVADKNYVYVLGKNTVTSTRAILNVVYMDGTVGEMTIDRDNYNDIFQNRDSAFGKAYAYTADGDIYEIDDENLTTVYGYAWKLRDGSLALYEDESARKFVDSYSYEKQIWNVENVSADDTNAPAGAFSTNVGKEVVLVLDAANKENVRAAFIERTLTNETTPVHDFNWNLTNYRTLYGDATAADIAEAMDDGYNVMIRGDYNMNSNIYTRNGKILYVTGNLDTNNWRVTGDGTLWVGGNYTVDNGTSNDYINVPTQVGGNVSFTNATVDINANLYVQDGDVTANASGNVVNVQSSADVYIYDGNGNGVGGDMNGNVLNVYGHVEAVDYNFNIINIYSNTTLVASGNVNIGSALNVGDATRVGAAEIAGSVTGSGTVTVTNGSLEVDGTIYPAVVVESKGSLTAYAVNSTLTAEAGASIDLVVEKAASIPSTPSGTFDYYTILADATTVAVGTTATFNDGLDTNGETLTVNGTVVLNGEVTGLAQISGGTNGAKITFGSDVTFSKGTTVPGNYVWGGENGAAITELKDLVGKTFTFNGTNWVSSAAAPTQPTETKATMTITSGTYTLADDTLAVKVTDTNKNDTGIEVEVATGAANVSLNLGLASGVRATLISGGTATASQPSAAVITVAAPQASETIKVQVSGTGLTTQTYTITIKVV